MLSVSPQSNPVKFGYIDHGVDGDTMLMPAQGHFAVEKQSPCPTQSMPSVTCYHLPPKSIDWGMKRAFCQEVFQSGGDSVSKDRGWGGTDVVCTQVWRLFCLSIEPR